MVVLQIGAVALTQSKLVAQPTTQAPFKQMRPSSQSAVSLQAPGPGGGGGLGRGGGGGGEDAAGGGGGDAAEIHVCNVASQSWPAGHEVAVQTHLPLVAQRGRDEFFPAQNTSPRYVPLLLSALKHDSHLPFVMMGSQ